MEESKTSSSDLMRQKALSTVGTLWQDCKDRKKAAASDVKVWKAAQTALEEAKEKVDAALANTRRAERSSRMRDTWLDYMHDAITHSSKRLLIAKSGVSMCDVDVPFKVVVCPVMMRVLMCTNFSCDRDGDVVSDSWNDRDEWYFIGAYVLESDDVFGDIASNIKDCRPWFGDEIDEDDEEAMKDVADAKNWEVRASPLDAKALSRACRSSYIDGDTKTDKFNFNFYDVVWDRVLETCPAWSDMDYADFGERECWWTAEVPVHIHLIDGTVPTEAATAAIASASDSGTLSPLPESAMASVRDTWDGSEHDLHLQVKTQMDADKLQAHGATLKRQLHTSKTKLFDFKKRINLIETFMAPIQKLLDTDTARVEGLEKDYLETRKLWEQWRWVPEGYILLRACTDTDEFDFQDVGINTSCSYFTVPYHGVGRGEVDNDHHITDTEFKQSGISFGELQVPSFTEEMIVWSDPHDPLVAQIMSDPDNVRHIVDFVNYGAVQIAVDMLDELPASELERDSLTTVEGDVDVVVVVFVGQNWIHPSKRARNQKELCDMLATSSGCSGCGRRGCSGDCPAAIEQETDDVIA